MLSQLTTILFFLFPSVCFGSADSVIPFGMLFSQFINLSLLAGLILFFQGKNIKKAFKNKKDQYLKAIESAQKSKKQAQKTLDNITQKLDKMSESFDEKIQEARQNAENSYQNQLATAHKQAQNLKQLAEKNFQFEIKKQMETLKKESLQKTINLAKKEMKQKAGLENLKKWNSHFTLSKGPS